MNIPKIIHQIHLGSSPLSHLEKKWQLSWKKNNPEYIYILWDEQKIAQHIEITHTKAFYDCKNFSEKSDILRFEILYQFGGVYVDTDFECLKSIDDLLETSSGLVVYEESPGVACGAFLASSKQNPLIKLLIDGIQYQYENFNNLPSNEKYGPIYLSKTLEGFTRPNGKDVVFPYSWKEPHRKHENFSITMPHVYAVHHWHSSWSDNSELLINESFDQKKLGVMDKNFLFKASHNFTKQSKNRVAILVWSFPDRSNTFVMNEIIEMHKKGLDFVVYSMSQTTEECRQLYSDQLKLIGHKIINIPGKKLLCHKSLREDAIAFYQNEFRLSLELCKTIDEDQSNYNQQEQECVQRSAKFLKSFLQSIESEKITKIYAPFASGDAEKAMMISYHTGIPYYFTAHAYDLFSSYFYTRMKAKTLSHCFAISEYNKKYMIEKLGIPEDKITVRRINFLAPEEKNIQAKRFDFEYIFSAGRLCEMKGFHYSIKAFSEFHKKYPHVHYIIVGCGELEASLKKMIYDLNLQDFVHMVGHIKNHEVLEYVKGALYSILSSIEMPNKDKEGLPTCFVESMSLGVPCVGTDYSGIPELIDHEVNGMLSKEKDVQDITYKMCKLYEMIKNDNTGSISESCKLKVSSMFNNEENINLLLEYLK
tara:strand:- start:5284 stop:7230 length:1947 start_codon:yes stop_codon:yes gene_type:complete